MPMRTREEQREYQRKWVAARRAEFFKDKECIICGWDEDLELDHIDPATKVANSIWSWSKERRNEEISKCQILCYSCHKKKTSKEQSLSRKQPIKHGTPQGYRKGCGCKMCFNSFSEYMKMIRNTRY